MGFLFLLAKQIYMMQANIFSSHLLYLDSLIIITAEAILQKGSRFTSHLDVTFKYLLIEAFG